MESIDDTNWDGPKQNNLDAVPLKEIQVPKTAMGMAVENSEAAATHGEMSPPQFHGFNQQRFYVDVFNQ